ncbi:hypothetical protein FRC16_011244 [Serendipita sp. 398]|nr:hypothetical protein FRC16_011244 [Serendipita sp. 398]
MHRPSRSPLDPQLANSDEESDAGNIPVTSPASRLRAAMNRLNSSGAPERRRSSPPESDYDLNPVLSARKSLKDVFSRAMRANTNSSDSEIAPGPSNVIDVEIDQDESQVSDSNIHLSSQVASFQLLRQRLELPEMSSRMEASQSAFKAPRSQQTLQRLLQVAQDGSVDNDGSVDTARAASPSMAYDGNTPWDTSGDPVRRMSGGRAEFRTPSPPVDMPELPAPPHSDEEPSLSLLAAEKTPRPPGGWFTPTRPAAESFSQSIAGQTPAPPGAWKSTPAASESRKSTARVRFEELESEVSQKSRSESEDTNIQPAVTLVDSYGRERKLDQDGNDIDIPDLAPESASPRLATSVRIVDSLGNELERSLASEISEEYDHLDYSTTVASMNNKINDMRKGFDAAENRHVSSQNRRTQRRQSATHDRILQLAMESRESRIEREKLLKQSHLVRVRQDNLTTKIELPGQEPGIQTIVITSSPWSMQRWLAILTSQILLLWLIYSFARAYVRHYYLTSHYDPTFATTDPLSIYRIAFLQHPLIPSRWKAFAAHGTSQILAQLIRRGINSNMHMLSFFYRPINSITFPMPS